MSVEQASLMLLRIGANTIIGGQSASLSISRQLIETNSKDSEWKQRLPGRISWNASGEFLNDLDDVNGQQAIRAAIYAATTLTLNITKASNVTGDRSFSGTVHVENVSETAPDNEAARFSVSFRGTGALTVTTT